MSFPQPFQNPLVTDLARSLTIQIQNLNRQISLGEARVRTLLSHKNACWAVFEEDRRKILIGKSSSELQYSETDHLARIEKAKTDCQEAEGKLALLYVQRWQISEKLRDEEVMAKAYADLKI